MNESKDQKLVTLQMKVRDHRCLNIYVIIAFHLLIKLKNHLRMSGDCSLDSVLDYCHLNQIMNSALLYGFQQPQPHESLSQTFRSFCRNTPCPARIRRNPARLDRLLSGLIRSRDGYPESSAPPLVNFSNIQAYKALGFCVG